MQTIGEITAARATVRLQIRLNKTMYEKGHIPHDIYARANEALQERLCGLGNYQCKGLNEIA